MKVLVIPCSGIGKVFGSVGREAALQVVEALRPGQAETMCLSLLVMGDDEARARLQGRPTVTIDGCPLACARKNIELAGGTVRTSIMVVDIYRQHKELKSQAVTFLDENGRQLAGWVAQAAAEAVDEVQETRGEHDA